MALKMCGSRKYPYKYPNILTPMEGFFFKGIKQEPLLLKLNSIIRENYSQFFLNLLKLTCRYGIETFSQLIAEGSLVNSTVNIDDEPRYVHRGLMLDTG